MGSDGTNMLVAQSDRWTQKPDKLREVNHTVHIVGKDILPCLGPLDLSLRGSGVWHLFKS